MAIPYRPEFYNPKSAYVTMELTLGGKTFDACQQNRRTLTLKAPEDVEPGVGHYRSTLNEKVFEGPVFVPGGISADNPEVKLEKVPESMEHLIEEPKREVFA